MPASPPPPLADYGEPPCDLVVFSAHPDDAELCCAGLLITARERGWRTGVVDFTRGESASLGTPEQRAAEARAATETLDLAFRRNLGLPDGRLHDDESVRELVVRTVRELRPRVVVSPQLDDHHPDHTAVAEVLKRGFYLCGVKNYLPELPPFRPRALLRHLSLRPFRVDLIVDVSRVLERRMEAVRCYRSQFGGEQLAEFPVRIASKNFLMSVEASLRHYGSLIGVAAGEPFTLETPLAVRDLVGLYETDAWDDR